jgi:hypothetical protein
LTASTETRLPDAPPLPKLLTPRNLGSPNMSRPEATRDAVCGAGVVAITDDDILAIAAFCQ